jgi:hypothetical protein
MRRTTPLRYRPSSGIRGSSDTASAANQRFQVSIAADVRPPSRSAPSRSPRHPRPRRRSTTRGAGSRRPRRHPRRARPAPRRGFPTRGARGRRPRCCRRPLLAAASPPRCCGPRAAVLHAVDLAPPLLHAAVRIAPPLTLRLKLIHAARAASFTPPAQVLAAPPRLLHAIVRLALLRLEQ